MLLLLSVLSKTTDLKMGFMLQLLQPCQRRKQANIFFCKNTRFNVSFNKFCLLDMIEFILSCLPTISCLQYCMSLVILCHISFNATSTWIKLLQSVQIHYCIVCESFMRKDKCFYNILTSKIMLIAQGVVNRLQLTHCFSFKIQHGIKPQSCLNT